MRQKLIMIVGFGLFYLVWAPIAAGEVLDLTTSTGSGGETYVSNYGADNVRGTHELLASFDLSEERSDKIYLRFDLSSVNHKSINSSALRLNPVSGFYRDQSFNVFGLMEKPAGERGGFDVGGGMRLESLHWESAPANIRDVGGGVWQRQMPSSGGIDNQRALYLGVMRFRPGFGKAIKFTSRKLAAFLNGDTDGMVTLILTRVNPNGVVTRFAGSGHPYLAPPTLRLNTSTYGPAQDERFLTEHQGILTHPFAELGETDTLELRWRAIQLLAVRGSWDAAHEMLSEFQEKAVPTPQTSGGDASIGRSVFEQKIGLVTRLLRVELRLWEGELGREEWAGRIHDILNRPAAGEDVVMAGFALCGRSVGQSKPGWDIDALLEGAVPLSSRSALLGIKDLYRTRTDERFKNILHHQEILSHPFKVADETDTLELRWHAIQLQAIRGSWDTAHQMLAGFQAAMLSGSASGDEVGGRDGSRVLREEVGVVTRLLEVELGLWEAKWGRDEWARRYRAILNQPAASHHAVMAGYALCGRRAGLDKPAWDIEALLEESVSVGARTALLDLNGLNHPQADESLGGYVDFYNQELIDDDKSRFEPYWVRRHYRALKAAGRDEVADYFVDHVVGLSEDPYAQSVALLMRFDAQGVHLDREKRVFELLEGYPEAASIPVVRRYVLNSMQRQGRLAGALEMLSLKGAGASSRVEGRESTLARLMDSVEKQGGASVLNDGFDVGVGLEQSFDPLSVLLELARELAVSGYHEDVAFMLFEGIRNGHPALYNLSSGERLGSVGDLVSAGHDRDAWATARLMMALTKELLLRNPVAKSDLIGLLKNEMSDAVRAQLHFHIARLSIQVLDTESALTHARETVALIPESELASRLTRFLEREVAMSRDETEAKSRAWDSLVRYQSDSIGVESAKDLMGVADEALKLGWVEQAIWAYRKVALGLPGNPYAKEAHGRCLVLLDRRADQTAFERLVGLRSLYLERFGLDELERLKLVSAE